MLFPIHDENPRRRAPIVTLLLVAVLLLVWLTVQGAGIGLAFARSLCELGMIPGELSGQSVGVAVPLGDGLACLVDAAPAWHTVLTSMFLHGDWFHLISNLWFLWLFGDNVEDELGRVGFVLFYVGCGIAASMAQLAIDPGSPVPMIGASGAISGVMGAYVVMYPRAPVRVFALLLVIPVLFRVPALLMLGYWFALQLLGGLPQLAGAGAGIGVAFWAHVGGFLAGALVALVVRRRHAEPRPAYR